jgi:hypothetical protein
MFPERFTALSVARMRLPALWFGEKWSQNGQREEEVPPFQAAPRFFMD